MAEWTYSPSDKQYRNAAGEVMSDATMREVRDAYLDEVAGLIDDYASNLASGRWTVAMFEREMRARLKNVYVSEYVLGRGGVNTMKPEDWGRVGNMLRNQYGYLSNFLNDLSRGEETEGTARNRGKQFLGSARQAYSRGRGRAFGFTLPCHPGDGGTPCHGNCRCHWEIDEDTEEIRAYWHTGGNDPCTGCQLRQSNYSPFVFVREAADDGS